VNIFYLDHDVKKCAEMHNDKHCVKMILEYAQLLSTTHRILDGVLSTGVSPTGRKKTVYALADNRDSILYSATHVKHPSCVWVRKSVKKDDWLFALFQSLMDEYTYRYGKVHACTKLEMALARIPENMPWAPFTEPTPAMPDDCKVIGNSIASYRNYYIMNKTHLAKWKNRPIPEWYNDNTPRIYEPQAS
jgi:hypothetical protein